jgi:protein-disulfide isomerase
MIRHLTSAFAMCMVLSGPVLSLDLNTMTDSERDALRAEIRAYLLENPEVIMEAVAVLEKREAAQQDDEDKMLVQSNADALFDDPNSWVGGNPEGDITMVEFVDYRCGYCRKAHDEVAALLKSDGNIRLIVKDFPILGEASNKSARFAVAVRQLAGDDAYHDAGEALIRLKGQPTDPALTRLASSLGLESAEVLKQMYSPDVDAVIAANHALGGKLKINGTPTFVIEDRMLRGYLPLDGMQALVAELRGE